MIHFHNLPPRRVVKNETICTMEVAYTLTMTSMNRAIPVAIAVFRYCCVFHDNIMRDPRKKWHLQNFLIWLIVIPVGLVVNKSPRDTKAFPRYNECMGREESSAYNLDDFYLEKDFDLLSSKSKLQVSGLEKF